MCCVRWGNLKKHIEGVHVNIRNFEHDSFYSHAPLQVILFLVMQNIPIFTDMALNVLMSFINVPFQITLNIL